MCIPTGPSVMGRSGALCWQRLAGARRRAEEVGSSLQSLVLNWQSPPRALCHQSSKRVTVGDFSVASSARCPLNCKPYSVMSAVFLRPEVFVFCIPAAYTLRHGEPACWQLRTRWNQQLLLNLLCVKQWAWIPRFFR